MKVDNALILKLENLAKLKLSEEEKHKLMFELEKIIEMFSLIEEVDTANVDPMIHMNDTYNQLRNDEIGEHLDIESFSSNAPLMIEKMFAVPKVIE
jgi:aspartyl-tRNA(Asn)/glutamyl-tRNA(Gln) amidotransferase subunit C